MNKSNCEYAWILYVIAIFLKRHSLPFLFGRCRFFFFSSLSSRVCVYTFREIQWMNEWQQMQIQDTKFNFRLGQIARDLCWLMIATHTSSNRNSFEFSIYWNLFIMSPLDIYSLGHRMCTSARIVFRMHTIAAAVAAVAQCANYFIQMTIIISDPKRSNWPFRWNNKCFFLRTIVADDDRQRLHFYFNVSRLIETYCWSWIQSVMTLWAYGIALWSSMCKQCSIEFIIVYGWFHSTIV